ncbi:uncharacterized protein LOC126766917 [Bactrocera neohumeralis]|uniref:uncharacterized protein LOC126766917 n=1 Tax=Bactrocera neohumeralis TaxID=98809 RepID=UPI00216520B3|nr:uncharacterized protein LOC126766917 [Bactrocera neohumeralis]
MAVLRAEFYQRVKQQELEEGGGTRSFVEDPPSCLPQSLSSSPSSSSRVSHLAATDTSSSSSFSFATSSPSRRMKASEEEAALLKMLEVADNILAEKRRQRQQQQQQQQPQPQPRAVAFYDTAKKTAVSPPPTSAMPSQGKRLYAPPSPTASSQVTQLSRRDREEESEAKGIVNAEEDLEKPPPPPPLPSSSSAHHGRPQKKQTRAKKENALDPVASSRRSSVTPPPRSVLAYINSRKEDEKERALEFAPHPSQREHDHFPEPPRALSPAEVRLDSEEQQQQQPVEAQPLTDGENGGEMNTGEKESTPTAEDDDGEGEEAVLEDAPRFAHSCSAPDSHVDSRAPSPLAPDMAVHALRSVEPTTSGSHSSSTTASLVETFDSLLDDGDKEKRNAKVKEKEGEEAIKTLFCEAETASSVEKPEVRATADDTTASALQSSKSAVDAHTASNEDNDGDDAEKDDCEQAHGNKEKEDSRGSHARSDAPCPSTETAKSNEAKAAAKRPPSTSSSFSFSSTSTPADFKEDSEETERKQADSDEEVEFSFGGSGNNSVDGKGEEEEKTPQPTAPEVAEPCAATAASSTSSSSSHPPTETEKRDDAAAETVAEAPEAFTGQIAVEGTEMHKTDEETTAFTRSTAAAVEKEEEKVEEEEEDLKNASDAVDEGPQPENDWENAAESIHTEDDDVEPQSSPPPLPVATPVEEKEEGEVDHLDGAVRSEDAALAASSAVDENNSGEHNAGKENITNAEETEGKRGEEREDDDGHGGKDITAHRSENTSPATPVAAAAAAKLSPSSIPSARFDSAGNDVPRGGSNSSTDEKRVRWAQELCQEVSVPPRAALSTNEREDEESEEEEEDEECFEVCTPPSAVAVLPQPLERCPNNDADAASPEPRGPGAPSSGSPLPLDNAEEAAEAELVEEARGSPAPKPVDERNANGDRCETAGAAAAAVSSTRMEAEGVKEEAAASASSTRSPSNGSHVCQLDAEAFLERLNGLEALLLHRFPQYFALAPSSSSADATSSVCGEQDALSVAEAFTPSVRGSSSSAAAPRPLPSFSRTPTEQLAPELIVRKPTYAPPQLTAPLASSSYSRAVQPRGMDALTPLCTYDGDNGSDCEAVGFLPTAEGASPHNNMSLFQMQEQRALGWSPAKIPPLSSFARDSSGSLVGDAGSRSSRRRYSAGN